MPVVSRRRTTAPAFFPLTLQTAKQQCRVDGHDDDADVLFALGASVAEFERLTGIQCLDATFVQTFDSFWPGDLVLLPAPLRSVVSIKYDDAGDVEQTVSSSVYGVDVSAGNSPGVVYLRASQGWPVTTSERQSVRVEYVSGYGSERTDVPENLRHAIASLTLHLFDNRAVVGDTGGRPASVPFGFQSIVDGVKIHGF